MRQLLHMTSTVLPLLLPGAQTLAWHPEDMEIHPHQAASAQYLSSAEMFLSSVSALWRCEETPAPKREKRGRIREKRGDNDNLIL